MEINLEKYGKVLIPVLLIVLAVCMSTYLRMTPDTMPATDAWAESSLTNQYYSQVEAGIRNKYPNLPDEIVKTRAREEELPAELSAAVSSASNQIKDHHKNENGDTYLLAIDPYLWYHYTRNYLEYGTSGDKNVEGKTFDTLRGGRLDRPENFRLHAWLMAKQHQILSPLTGWSLTKSIFMFPVIWIALSLIPAFFITRRLIGNYGAFFASALIAINGALLSRTIGGFSDTDTYNILCPLFITWFLFEAFCAKEDWKRYGLTVLAGLGVAFYRFAWGGWWYIFDFILAALGMYILYLGYKKNKNAIIKYSTIMFTFIVSSLGVIAVFSPKWDSALQFLKGPLSVIALKSVGESTLWPNVLTTVAEFNTQGFSQLINSIGGMIILFVALFGLAVLYTKNKKMFFLLSIWSLGGAYAFTKGTRFSILLIPAVAIALGVGVGYSMKVFSSFVKNSLNIKNDYAKYVVAALFLLLLVPQFGSSLDIAKNQVPSMNDAWYDALTEIKEDSNDSIITSWWDFGHWFYTVAERRVTFDGGDQGKRIYWVGRVLYEENETVALNILKMLNCGQNTYYETLIENGDSEKVAIDKVLQSVEQGTYTCDYLPQYFIASSDMIGKAGVWAHFGSWDFDRAQIWNNVKKGKLDGIDLDTQYEAKTTPADRWISDWPSYMGRIGCSQSDTEIKCENGLIISANLTVNTDKIRYISYLDMTGNFSRKEISPEGEFSILISPKGVYGVDNRLSASVFTKAYFFEGKGLDNFEMFTHKTSLMGPDIYVYKVKLDSRVPYYVEETGEGYQADEAFSKDLKGVKI